MIRFRFIALIFVLGSLPLSGCTEEISRKESWGPGTSGFSSQYRGGNPLSSSDEIQFETQKSSAQENFPRQKKKESGWFDWLDIF